MLLVPYKNIDGKSFLLSEEEISELAPNSLAYLRECKNRLNAREKGRFKGRDWFCYGRPQNMNLFEVEEKIVLPDISNGSNFTIDKKKHWLLDTIYGLVKKEGINISLNYILAILNSRVLTAYLMETGTALRGGYFRVKTSYINPFPIPTIDFSNSEGKARHDRIVNMVEQMMKIKDELTKAKIEEEINRLEMKCANLNGQIDEAVYELYGLTEEEIKIVEGVEKK